MRLTVLVLCVLLCIALQRARAQENVTGASGEDDGPTAMESADEELDYMQLLRNTVAGGFANMPVALRRRLLSADVTPECNVGLLRFMRAMQNLEPWALRLLDASGKLPSGLLQGSRVDLGAFDECLETEIYDTYGDVLMRGQYCNLLVYNENSTAVEGKIQTFSNVLHPKLKYFSNYFSVEELPVMRLAMCTVDECNQRDLQALVDAVKPPLVRLEVSNCVTAEVEPWTNAQMGIMMFLCVLLVIIIAATLTDRLMKLKPKLMEKYGALGELVKGFSATSNTRMLLKVAEKSNTDHYALQFLHGMRFFSILHIVFGHCGQTMSDNWSRYLNLLIASDEWSFMFISAGFSSVGTFFFLSGFFLCLTVSREKRGGPIVFIIGVIRRFIRTAIPLFFIIMCLYLMPRFVFGPDTKAFFLKLHKDVASHWWHLLLMIRNFVEISAWDMLPHTWYLSTDFQLFTASLVILLVFKSRKMLAVGAFILLSLLGCAIGTWVVASSDLLPFMVFPGPVLQVMSKTVNEYYLRPFYHAVCYFSGCLTYLVMEDFRQRKISKTVQVTGWCVYVSCALLCIFMKLAWYRSPDPTSEAVKLLAAFFDRILWAVSLIWITLACSSGRGGLVSKFLSCNVFVPLSKLSFGVYLIHVPFIELYLHASRERIFWSKFNMVTLLFAILAWSYLLAYLAFLACEAPTGALDKFIFTRLIHGGGNARKRHPTQQNVSDEKPQINVEDGVSSRC
ncbi:nose resistant to fluoxetine protein 6-like [Dermacentor variabilis]|uniref:nose resistant to fluoxetine protein 6-like n=1 Tax=Dermacentor variabilis TaxID=34621 RepID=UPI003F5BB30E